MVVIQVVSPPQAREHQGGEAAGWQGEVSLKTWLSGSLVDHLRRLAAGKYCNVAHSGSPMSK